MGLGLGLGLGVVFRRSDCSRAVDALLLKKMFSVHSITVYGNKLRVIASKKKLKA